MATFSSDPPASPMSYRGRFAPTPSGPLHFGSLVAAVGSWLRARQAGGAWLLRIDDLDPPREQPGAADAIVAALPAFGLYPDEAIVFQSTRRAAYDAAFSHLQAIGAIFPCWCSRSKLAAAGGVHRDGKCISQAVSQRPPAWRVYVPHDLTISFDDALQGPQQQAIGQEGDFVIRRVDGYYAYHLACVVDDAWQGISEIVRGRDLMEESGRQIYLQRLLGLPTPAYLHLPLVLDANGTKLSKSHAAAPLDPSLPLDALRQSLGFLGLGGQIPGTTPAQLLTSALRHFDQAVLSATDRLRPSDNS